MNASTETMVAGQSTAPNTGRDLWSSRLAFILVASGSAVGLGNVWKFPYITGEHGGGAFVLVYLVCIALIGLPILMAEVLIGRRGQGSPIHSMRRLAAAAGASRHWRLLGWLGALGSFLILSFYSVVAGWSLAYLWYALTGKLSAHPDDAQVAEQIGAVFKDMLADPEVLIGCHTLIAAATVFIVAMGVKGGLERAARWMMPGLFVLLIALVVYAAVTTEHFVEGAAFLFQPDFSALSLEAVLVALGHAFFTLSVGMTAMMAYGSHLARTTSIARASITVATVDTVVALLAGLAIFPLVFSHGLEAGSGPGLIFVTLPIAFSAMPGGAVVAVLFFLFLTIAALTSAISLLEPSVEYIEDQQYLTRPAAAVFVGAAIWALGLVAALSFNAWAGFTVFDKTMFDLMDFVAASVMLPIGGVLIALFCGWALSRETTCRELGLGDGLLFRVWRLVLRYLTPMGVAAVLVSNLA